MRIVGVQDGGLRHSFVLPLAEHLEEDALRFEVRLQGAVEIEVLGGQVREDGDVDVDAAELA